MTNDEPWIAMQIDGLMVTESRKVTIDHGASAGNRSQSLSLNRLENASDCFSQMWEFSGKQNVSDHQLAIFWSNSFSLIFLSLFLPYIQTLFPSPFLLTIGLNPQVYRWSKQDSLNMDGNDPKQNPKLAPNRAAWSQQVGTLPDIIQLAPGYTSFIHDIQPSYW